VREDVLYLHLHVLLRRAVSGDIHVSVVRRSIGHVAKPQNRATVPPTAIAKTRVAGSSPGRLIADIRRPHWQSKSPTGTILLEQIALILVQYEGFGP